MKATSVRGVFVPACTPFNDDLDVDLHQFVRHCRWLLAEGAHGLAVFGTTSEANSISASERMTGLERLIDSGISPSMLMPGTGCTALPDTVALTRHAVDAGCMGVLLLPPFYYKGVGDDGLYAGIARLVQRVADPKLRIYLYHIPPMASVGWSLDLIERLLKGFPGIVVGVKDSSGDWSNTKAMLERFPDFEVFPGSETFLLDALRLGGVGCISATANVNVRPMRALIDAWHAGRDSNRADCDAMQQKLSTFRAAVQKFPMVAANKSILSQVHDAPDWRIVRPPLTRLTDVQERQLFDAVSSLGYALTTAETASA